MAQTDYTYLITDTANDKVADDVLAREIRQETNITISLIAVSNDQTNITITFADALPGTQKVDYLDVLVAAHDGERETDQNYSRPFPVGSIEKSLFKSVAASGSEELDYVIPDNTKLHLHELGAALSNSDDTRVEIIWNPAGPTPTNLLIAPNSITRRSVETLNGNDSRILRIKLINDSASAIILGGYWIGKER